MGRNLEYVLLTTFNACGINIHFLREQGLNGTAAMNGKFKGVQDRITEKYPSVLCIYIVFHSA